MKYWYIVLLSLLLITCKTAVKPGVTDILKLNVPEEIPDTPGKLSEYFEKLTYIPLETNENSIIGPRPDFEIIAGDIFATFISFNCILLSINDLRLTNTRIGNDLVTSFVRIVA